MNNEEGTYPNDVGSIEPIPITERTPILDMLPSNVRNALEGIGIDPIERRGSLLTAQNIFGSMVHQAHPDVIQDGPNESADLLD